jgi:hypothetical protein
MSFRTTRHRPRLVRWGRYGPYPPQHAEPRHFTHLEVADSLQRSTPVHVSETGQHTFIQPLPACTLAFAYICGRTLGALFLSLLDMDNGFVECMRCGIAPSEKGVGDLKGGILPVSSAQLSFPQCCTISAAILSGTSNQVSAWLIAPLFDSSMRAELCFCRIWTDRI